MYSLLLVKNYLVWRLLIIGLKNGNQRTVFADFARDQLAELISYKKYLDLSQQMKFESAMLKTLNTL